MNDILTLANLGDLGVLIFLQAVLGFDNLLYISIESKRAPEDKQKVVRQSGILIAIALRIVLLFVVKSLIAAFGKPFFTARWTGYFEGQFNFSSLVFFLGGAFIMYTAVKEISHLLAIEEPGEAHGKQAKSAPRVVAMIVLMNLIFSFDSILSALAINKVFLVLAAAIAVSGVLMLVMANTVSEFIKKNRKYEVLGLFILLIVGVVLLGEGGHESHLKLFGYAVEPMAKTTFYFSIAVLVVVDVLQSGYQKKLEAQRQAQVGDAAPAVSAATAASPEDRGA